MSIKIITTATINKPINKVFDYVAPIDLSHIFKRYKYLPAVIGSNETEKWIKPGLSRTVFFEDGNSAFEELLVVKSLEYFAYKVSNFTSVLKYLITQINGNWKFSTDQNGFTNIIWEYELIPKNKFTSWIITTFLYKDISKLLQNAIDIISNDLKTN
jgi:hypothetical protein